MQPIRVYTAGQTAADKTRHCSLALASGGMYEDAWCQASLLHRTFREERVWDGEELSACTALHRERYYLSRFIAANEPFWSLTISSAMRGGREVVGILVRRDEVKPAFKQQQQLAAPARPTEQTSLPFTDRLRLLI